MRRPPRSTLFPYNDALPISIPLSAFTAGEGEITRGIIEYGGLFNFNMARLQGKRSEEHTSELQSHSDLVCGLMLEKKKGTPIRLNPENRGDRQLTMPAVLRP